jgi:hypothetical protein
MLAIKNFTFISFHQCFYFHLHFFNFLITPLFGSMIFKKLHFHPLAFLNLSIFLMQNFYHHFVQFSFFEYFHHIHADFFCWVLFILTFISSIVFLRFNFLLFYIFSNPNIIINCLAFNHHDLHIIQCLTFPYSMFQIVFSFHSLSNLFNFSNPWICNGPIIGIRGKSNFEVCNFSKFPSSLTHTYTLIFST